MYTTKCSIRANKNVRLSKLVRCPCKCTCRLTCRQPHPMVLSGCDPANIHLHSSSPTLQAMLLTLFSCLFYTKETKSHNEACICWYCIGIIFTKWCCLAAILKWIILVLREHMFYGERLPYLLNRIMPLFYNFIM